MYLIIIYHSNQQDAMTTKQVQVGSMFNETDSDSDMRVLSIKPEADPPTALCVKVVKEPEKDDDPTGVEYSLPYVVN